MRKLCNCDSDKSMACASCGHHIPDYASEIPFVPVNWEDRDNITGRILGILEAVMPEGQQLSATKDLVKDATKKYWIDLFNDQFETLQFSRQQPVLGDRARFQEALWRYMEKELEIDGAKNNQASISE